MGRDGEQVATTIREIGVDGLTDARGRTCVASWRTRKVEAVVRLALEREPKGRTHWSSRLMAKRAGVSQSSVSRIWRAFKIKPHRQSTFTLSPDDFLYAFGLTRH